MGFLSGSVIKNPSVNAEDGKTQVQSPGWEDPLEEERATQSSILVQRQRSLAVYSLWGHKEPDTTDLLSTNPV